LRDDGAERESCRGVGENSDASTARVARRVINLSSDQANEDGIFLHADVKATRDQSKSRNNPMHSSGTAKIIVLRIIRNKFDSSGKTGA
jgi:hypothetical protein